MPNPLTIDDAIYGSVTITEPVLLDLIASKPIQRLKHINQHGPMRQSQPQRGTITRYDHSIGTMLLLRKHGAELAEQVAGLLHDVSHTAFSHVVDYAMDVDDTQTFHETIKQKLVDTTEIPEILRSYDFNPEYILEAENFKLLERDEPELCADRIDYLVRDSVITFDLLKPEEGQALHNALRTVNDEWYFVDQASAEKYANDFLNCAEQGWYSPTNMAAFHILGTVMKELLQRNIITEQDLFLTDEEFYAKCKNCTDADIQRLLKKLENLQATYDYDHRRIIRTPKLRVADPYFLAEDKLIRLSDVDTQFQKRLAKHTEWIKNGVPFIYI